MLEEENCKHSHQEEEVTDAASVKRPTNKMVWLMIRDLTQGTDASLNRSYEDQQLIAPNPKSLAATQKELFC